MYKRQVEQIRKAAQIAKANAQRDITIAEANAKEEANRVKVETDQRIAEQDTTLSIKQAELKTQASVKQAEADASYDIQKQVQRRAVEIASVEDVYKRQQSLCRHDEIPLRRHPLFWRFATP